MPARRSARRSAPVARRPAASPSRDAGARDADAFFARLALNMSQCPRNASAAVRQLFARQAFLGTLAENAMGVSIDAFGATVTEEDLKARLRIYREPSYRNNLREQFDESDGDALFAAAARLLLALSKGATDKVMTPQ
jgi:hypothetical protein